MKNIESKIIDEHRRFWGAMPELLDRTRQLGKLLGVATEKLNERLVRYYVAQGLLERPDRLGREAAFNLRHLLQLTVALYLAPEKVTLEIIGWHNSRSTNRQLVETLDGAAAVNAARVKSAFQKEFEVNSKSHKDDTSREKSFEFMALQGMVMDAINSQNERTQVQERMLYDSLETQRQMMHELVMRQEKVSHEQLREFTDRLSELQHVQMKVYESTAEEHRRARQEMAELREVVARLVDGHRALQIQLSGYEKVNAQVLANKVEVKALMSREK